jgi:hypothetical protein
MGLIRDGYGDVRTYVKVLGIVAGISGLIGGCVGGCVKLNEVEYSSGSRVGVINKVSSKGLFWKTYEAQMAMEGLTSRTDSGANVWDFSIDNQVRNRGQKEKLVALLNDALQTGKKVKIRYIEAPGVPVPWRGKTTYYAQDVELAEARNQ